jgi:hypothetical protein
MGEIDPSRVKLDVRSVLRASARTGALVVALAVVAAPRPVCAAPAADEALAETLFSSGKELMKERRWDDACAKFDAARKLSPGIGVTMWLAECHENAGRLATAWLYFRDAAASARARSDDRAKLADDRARKLEGRVARVRLVADDGFHGDVYRDAVKLPAEAIGEATPVDPGTYRYRFVEPGRPTREVRVEVKEEGRTYEVRASGGAVVADAVVAAPAPAPRPARPAEARAGRGLGYVLLGVGAVGVAVGSGFGLDAATKHARSNDGHCTGALCDAEGVELRDQALASATVSTIAFAVGAAALVAGAAVFLGVFDRARPAAVRSMTSLSW